MDYESVRTVESKVQPGVRFRIAKMSFARRLDLMTRVRAAARAIEYHAAGESATDKLEAALAAAEVDRLYLEWGLAGVEGLVIDGQAADAALLASAGPEELCREAIDEIKRECGLSAEERKN